MPRLVGGDEFVRFQLDSMSSSDYELLRGVFKEKFPELQNRIGNMSYPQRRRRAPWGV